MSNQGDPMGREDNDYVYLKAGAGESWHGFVMHCLNHDLWPGWKTWHLSQGNVGASPMQNIGAYGVEVRRFFMLWMRLTGKTGEMHSFGLSDCAFGYRESVFKQQYRNRFIITSVTYRLLKTTISTSPTVPYSMSWKRCR